MSQAHWTYPRLFHSVSGNRQRKTSKGRALAMELEGEKSSTRTLWHAQPTFNLSIQYSIYLTARNYELARCLPCYAGVNRTIRSRDSVWHRSISMFDNRWIILIHTFTLNVCISNLVWLVEDEHSIRSESNILLHDRWCRCSLSEAVCFS